MRRLHLLGLALFPMLAGCWGHVFPPHNGFPASDGVRARVFVDANGTFYPTGWRQFMDRQTPWREDSLLNEAADQPDFRTAIDADESRQLDEIAALVAGKRRVLILVHGYNNTVEETEAPYEAIETAFALSNQDAVIRFNWDGLTGSGIGGGKIWFNATGYSQMAGMRGLRRILDRISGKDVYIVSHSRGASVVLSALSNPPFAPNFEADTKRVSASWPGGDPGLFTPPPLKENGNRIRVLMLAPAIDRIDFCKPGEITGCAHARPLTPQLCSLRYTVNSSDPVLRKFVGLQANFNPTGLGQNAAVGAYLAQHGAAYLKQTVLKPAGFHGFGEYVAHPAFRPLFAEMLADSTCG